jgi:hypothetical protein
MRKLEWFLAKLVFQISVEGKDNTSQFEEQFRLIKADELKWAAEKASIIGKMEEINFLNKHHQMVSWKFIETVEVLHLEGIDDGMELYVQTEEPENVNSYIEIVKSKARRLSDKLKQHHRSIIAMPDHQVVEWNAL